MYCQVKRPFQDLKWPEPVSKLAQFVTTNMTIFCNQLFLALTDVTHVALTDASVKVVLYKRCTFCPVFFARSTTEEASHSWGETFGDQKRHRLVCGKLLKNHDPARITEKKNDTVFIFWWFVCFSALQHWFSKKVGRETSKQTSCPNHSIR